MNLQKKFLPMQKLEVKQLDDGSHELIGYGSVFGVKDLQGDVVEKGSFTKTLKERAGRIKLCYQHDFTHGVIGKVIEAYEDDTGLFIRAKILPTQLGKDVALLVQSGVLDGLSIGYSVVKEDYVKGVRHIKELRLYEVSIVSEPANQFARVSGFKGVVPFKDLPLADKKRKWDADAAEGRIRKWAGGPEKENIDWGKYRKAFLWYDEEDPENFTSYKLPIADVIDGQLKAVPRAIYAAAAAIQGARGGVNIPAEDKEKVKNHLAKYYKKMGETPPWSDEGKQFYKEYVEKAADFNTILVTEELRDSFWKLFFALREAIELIVKDTTIDDKPAAVNETLEQFRTALLAWIVRANNLGIFNDEDATEVVTLSADFSFDKKAGRVLSAKNREVIKKALSAMGDATEALNALLAAAEPDDQSTPKGNQKPHEDTKNGSKPGETHLDQKDIEEAKKLLEELRKLNKK